MPESPPLPRQRLAKTLPIIASAFFAVAAVLLCLMWVRSYWMRDMVFRTSRTLDLCLSSRHGSIHWYSNDLTGGNTSSWSAVRWRVVHHDLSDFVGERGHGFRWQTSREGVNGRAPYWFIVSIAGFLSVISWALPRFSLRTGLILTTIFAVFFAIVGASLRN